MKDFSGLKFGDKIRNIHSDNEHQFEQHAIRTAGGNYLINPENWEKVEVEQRSCEALEPSGEGDMPETPPESPESSPNEDPEAKYHREKKASTAHPQGPEVPLSSWEGIEVGMRLRCLDDEGMYTHKGGIYTVSEVEPGIVWLDDNACNDRRFHRFSLIPDPEKRCATEVSIGVPRVWKTREEIMAMSGCCDCGGSKLRHQEHALWCSSRG